MKYEIKYYSFIAEFLYMQIRSTTNYFIKYSLLTRTHTYEATAVDFLWEYYVLCWKGYTWVSREYFMKMHCYHTETIQAVMADWLLYSTPDVYTRVHHR